MSEEKKAVKREFTLRLLIIISFIYALLFVSALAINAMQVRQTLVEVRSCTNPTGECYKRQQEASGNVVQSINDAVICANYYADRPGAVTEAEIRDCMERRRSTPSG